MNLDAAFWPALWKLAIDTATRPEIFLAVWYRESGLDPTAKNGIGCIGLNQSCPAELGGPGFPNGDADAYQAAPASAQVAWIAPQVKAAVNVNGRPFLSAARYYQANFLPATLPVATAPRDVIAAKNGPFAKAYAANSALDFGGDGAITLEDLGRFVAEAVQGAGRSPWLDALSQLYSRRPPESPWRDPDLILYEPAPSMRGPLGAIAAVGLVWALLRFVGGRA